MEKTKLTSEEQIKETDRFHKANIQLMLLNYVRYSPTDKNIKLFNQTLEQNNKISQEALNNLSYEDEEGVLHINSDEFISKSPQRERLRDYILNLMSLRTLVEKQNNIYIHYSELLLKGTFKITKKDKEVIDDVIRGYLDNRNLGIAINEVIKQICLKLGIQKYARLKIDMIAFKKSSINYSRWIKDNNISAILLPSYDIEKEYSRLFWRNHTIFDISNQPIFLTLNSFTESIRNGVIWGIVEKG